MTRARFLVHHAVASVSLNTRLLNRTRRNTWLPVAASRDTVMNTPGSISSTHCEPGVPELEPGVAGEEAEGEGEREGARAEVKAREVRLVRVVERARNHRAQRAAHT